MRQGRPLVALLLVEKGRIIAQTFPCVILSVSEESRAKRLKKTESSATITLLSPRFFGRCPQNDTLKGLRRIKCCAHTDTFLKVILSEAKNLGTERLIFRKGSAR